jgi:hypothetical protein
MKLRLFLLSNKIKGEIIMKITEILVSLLTKKGLLLESKNVDTEIEIPQSTLKVDNLDKSDKVIVRFKAENVTIKVLKED